MQRSVADENDIRAGRLGDPAAPVEPQTVIVAALLGMLLGPGATPGEAGLLCLGRRGLRARPPPRPHLPHHTHPELLATLLPPLDSPPYFFILAYLVLTDI